MKNNQITKNVFYIGVRDWDRRSFDDMVPLPAGTSYNSYLIKGSKKTAIIDTVEPQFTKDFLKNLKNEGIKKVDYIIANHAEQDHSGSIPALLKKYPSAKIVTNARCWDMLTDYLKLPDEKKLIADEETELSLGDKTLSFRMTPWVHWPETMVTYLKEDKLLFSCDFFGSHLAQSKVFVQNKSIVYEAAKLYYAQIMMPFRKPIRKNLEKVAQLDVKIIAPSHGPVYNDISFIVDAYNDWVSDEVKNEAVVLYVSMHESTKKMVDRLVDGLIYLGVVVKQFNIPDSDTGEIAKSLVDAATVVIATPTVLVGPHPAAAHAVFLANLLKPKTKNLALIGSYGWATTVTNKIKSFTPDLKAKLIEPVLIKGLPREEDLKLVDELAKEIFKRNTTKSEE